MPFPRPLTVALLAATVVAGGPAASARPIATHTAAPHPPAAGTATTTAPARCGLKRAYTVLRSPELRLVNAANPDYDEKYEPEEITYACHGRRGRARKLLDLFSADMARTGRLVASGRYIAGAYDQYPASCAVFLDCDVAHLVVVDDSVTGRSPVRTTSQDPVLRVALAPNGTVAWVAEAPATATTPAVRTVHVTPKDHTGSSVVATDPTVDPASLTVTRTTVSWVTAAGPQSAPADEGPGPSAG